MQIILLDKVSPYSNVLIYGAGNTGIEYLKIIKITNYCNVIGLMIKWLIV